MISSLLYADTLPLMCQNLKSCLKCCDVYNDHVVNKINYDVSNY